MNFLLSYAGGSLWLVPCLASGGWVASFFARRVGVGITHRVWVAALAFAVLVPALPALRGQLAWPVGKTDSSGHAMVSLHALQGLSGGGVGHSFSLSPEASRALCVVYGVAVLWALVRLLRSTISTGWLLARATPCVLQPEFDKVWAEAKRAFEVSPRLLFSADVRGPVTLGHRRPSVLLPACLLELANEGDLRAALLHELAHIKRHDFAKNLCYEIVSLPIAFHPAVWLLRARVAATREMMCDALAVDQAIAPREYARSLLRLATLVGPLRQAAPSNAIGIFDANILEKRVMELRAKKQPITMATRNGLTLAGVACLAVALAAGASAPVVIAATGTQAAGSSEIYQVGKDVAAPVLRTEAQPEFPEAVRKQKGTFSGSCEVALVVDRAGVPRDVHVVRSLGEGFDESAVKAVEQYRFAPGIRLGKAVPVALLVDVNFQKF